MKKPGFYSPLEAIAQKIPRTKGTPAEYMAEISKQPGYRAEEVADRKIGLPNQKMSREEFLAHLKAHPAPQIEEKEYKDTGPEYFVRDSYHNRVVGRGFKSPEEAQDWIDDHIGDDRYDDMSVEHDPEGGQETQYSEWQLNKGAGAKNYREKLLKLRDKLESKDSISQRLFGKPYSSLSDEERFAVTPEYQKGMKENYVSSHWRDDPNVLGHLRMSDRVGPNGEKILHLEEAQSDWHQEGRKKGYAQQPTKVFNPDGTVTVNFKGFSKTFKNEQYADDSIRTAMIDADKQVPNAPFKKSWHELILKKALQEAAHGGYHGIAITPGKEQADRYKLSKRLSELHYSGTNLVGRDHSGQDVIRLTGIQPEDLPRHIGKEATEKLMSQKPQGTLRSLVGEDLNVGGEGMEGFYDKILPLYLNKVGKPHGAKVDKVNIAGHDLHYFPIPDKMREEIKTKGLPLYRKGGIAHMAEGGTMALDHMRLALNKINPVSLQSIGANEAPNVSPKLYLPPDRSQGGLPPPGGVATPSGLPIGGVDMSRMQPGQQLMPQQPQQQPGAQGQQGGPEMPPGGAAGPAPGQAGPQSNILQMTPQGQMMAAMQPQQPQPQGMKDGGVTKRMQTVKDAQRMAYPGIYQRPDVIAALAASRVAPEDPALKQLFGVTREDLYQMSKGRVGNLPGELPGAAAKPRGSAAAAKVMGPRNVQRLLDVMGEAEKHPELVRGMDPWYVMDPLFQRLVQLVGLDQAKIEYEKMNTLMGMASPGSEVNTEIPRGTAAYYLQKMGRFEDFLKYAGVPEAKRTKKFPADIRNVPGHAYHKTAQATPMQQYLESGEMEMKSPKVPMYIQASGVPETGFQTATPVGDAHWSRAVGLADVRNPKTIKGKQVVPGASVTNPEMTLLGPWWREQVAGKLGLESVPAQARAWGTFSPQTGVTTPIGAPKLELIAKQIMQTAKRLGVSPETARDYVLMGKTYAGKKKGGKVNADTMRLAVTMKKAK